MTDEPRDPASVLVTPTGSPLKVTRATAVPCPKCGAPPSKRVASAGFGTDIHDVCNVCGWEFYGERTT